MTAIFYGLKRIYNTARGVEEILEFSVSEKVVRQELSLDLKNHIKMEHDRDQIRDKQLIELVANISEITREMRPNGGSSMKDVVNKTADKVGDIHTRVAVLEEWKRNTK